MSRRLRFVLIAIALFFICVAILLITAYAQGADPFHPRSRLAWSLGLITAFYAAIRLAMILDQVLKWRQGGASERPRLRGFGFLAKQNHPIDNRMAERRARVEAAQQKAKQGEDPKPKDSGDA